MATYRVSPSASDTVSTARLQDAIDRVLAAGGGTVIVEAGRYSTGTLTLGSNLELHLEAGAVITASPDPDDFIALTNAAGLYGVSHGAFLLQARDAENISVTGPGELNGNSPAYMNGWWTSDGPYIQAPRPWRPRGIGFHNCRRVNLREFTFRDSSSWTIHLTGCEDVLCHGLHILNRLDVPNCDGIDPDHCRNVRILGCHIEAADDCIVLKNTRQHVDCGPCENIIISGCTLVSTSAAIKLGTESAGDFRNVVVDSCLIRHSHRGLAIQLRDQGTIENITFSNCIVETRRFHPKYWGRGEAIYVTAVPRHDGDPAGKIRNVRFFNIDCRCEGGVFVEGSPDSPIEDLVMEQVRVEMRNHSRWPGGQHDLRPRHSQEHGGLREGPTHSVHLAHVNGVSLHAVRAGWRTDMPAWAGETLHLEAVHKQQGGVDPLPCFS